MRFAPLTAHSGEMLRLDLLRFIASVGIMWHHSHEFFYPEAQRAIITRQSQAMALFVDLFFVISGFVIAYVYRDRVRSPGEFGRFMQRRVGRLVPLHWLTLALAWAFWSIIARMNIGTDHPVDLSATCLGQTAFLTHAIVNCAGGSSPNGVSWSISTEMVLYLLFPLLGLLLRFPILFAAIGLAALGGGIAQSVALDVEWDKIYPPLRGLPAFMLGMALCRWRDRLGSLNHGSWAVLAAVAVTFVLMSSGAPQLIVLAGVYLIAALAVAADMNGAPGAMVTRFAPLGQLTYSIYMWHALIIIVVMNAIGDKLLKLSLFPMIGLAMLCYALVFAVSYLSWTLIETPARRWIDSW
ncbi:acyltransferase family protein [Sphingomonas sp. CJ99]